MCRFRPGVNKDNILFTDVYVRLFLQTLFQALQGLQTPKIVVYCKVWMASSKDFTRPWKSWWCWGLIKREISWRDEAPGRRTKSQRMFTLTGGPWSSSQVQHLQCHLLVAATQRQTSGISKGKNERLTDGCYLGSWRVAHEQLTGQQQSTESSVINCVWTLAVRQQLSSCGSNLSRGLGLIVSLAPDAASFH